MRGGRQEKVGEAGGRRVAPFAVACAATFGGLALVVGAGLAPHGDGRVVAVFPPWWSQARALRAAASAGRVAGVGDMRNVVLLKGESAGLERRASAAGALLLLDPTAAVGCVRVAEVQT
jgi:hypothetical protein